MKALFIILPIILLIGALVWGGYSFLTLKEEKTKEEEYEATDRWTGKTEKKTREVKYYVVVKNKLVQFISAVAVTIVSLLVLIIVPASIHQVNAGEIAVVKIWGEATEQKSAGLHFDFWISHKYEIYDAKVQQVIVETQAYSSDGQTMDIELVVQYQIQDALKIAVNYGGLDMLENRISTVSIEKMKSVLSQKSAMTIIETRATVSPDVETSIRNAITDDYYVSISTVVLTDISFTDTFEKVIEDKMVAEQQKLQAEYEKEKAIIQAEQALEVAKLEAEAKLAEAEGEAKALEEIAKAQANSIKLKSIETARMLGFTITETTTEDGIVYDIDFSDKTQQEINAISEYLKYIEYLENWNGELPEVVTGDSVSIMIPTP